MEGEDPGVYRFTERGLLGFGFQGLDRRAKALVGFVMSPLGFGGQGLVDIGQAVELEAQFAGDETLAALAVVAL